MVLSHGLSPWPRLSGNRILEAMPAGERQRVLAVSVATVQTSVTGGTFGSGAAGIMIHSSGGSTVVHKADDFQATLY